MKKLIKKLLSKVFKKVINKKVAEAVAEASVEPIVPGEKPAGDSKKAQEAGVRATDPWWVIVLKVLAYIIGLVLAGAATTSCSTMVMAMI